MCQLSLGCVLKLLYPCLTCPATIYIYLLCVPSGKRMNVGSNPAVGAVFFRRGKLVSATDTEQEWP